MLRRRVKKNELLLEDFILVSLKSRVLNFVEQEIKTRNSIIHQIW